MNSDGDIKQFTDEAEAQERGYKELLSFEEASVLLNIPKHERTKALKTMRKHQSLWARYFKRAEDDREKEETT